MNTNPFLQYVRQRFSVSLSVWQTLTNPSVTIYFWAQSHTLTFSLNLLYSPLGFLLLFLFLLQAHSKLEWHSRNCQNNPVFEDEYFSGCSFWKAQPANHFFSSLYEAHRVHGWWWNWIMGEIKEVKILYRCFLWRSHRGTMLVHCISLTKHFLW